jgi:hypothetical protein
LENNSGQPKNLTINRQSDSQTRVNVLFLVGFDEGGVIDYDDYDDYDDEREPIKLITDPCDSNSGY